MSLLRDSYAGDFDPDLSLADFSRQALCVLGREYLLLGHLIDRIGIPLVVQRYGQEDQVRFSIEEWMGASPIYSKRMQRALRFEGTTVETVFKNLQFEIGAPQQFMDFQFRLDDPDYGEFWLPHCGALLDIEPFGAKQVKLMCHDIEDPTFDATAAATNPRMKMRPIHRPPRVPDGRYPHCRWSVFIDSEGVPYEQHENLARIQATRLATIPIDLPDSDREPGGWPDYSGPFDPGAQHEDFSHRALLAINQEATVQAHLLVRAYLLCIANRHGDADAIEIAAQQWTGAAALAARRVGRCFGIEGDDIESIAKLFQIHPHFHPRSYIDFRVEILDPERARISMRDCAAFEEGDPYSWFAGLSRAPHPALDAICEAVNPHARCHPVDDPNDARLAWDIVIDRSREPQEETGLMNLARLSRGVNFELMQRRPLRN